VKHPADGTVVVAEFPSRHVAEIAAGLLRSAGLDADVVSDDTGAQNPALSLVRGAGVCVPEDQETAARDLLERSQADPDGIDPATLDD